MTLAEIIFSSISAFLGAFFAFCFFMVSRRFERKHEWKKTYKNEHAYLERYFYELKYVINDNKSILKSIIDGYRNKKILLNKLSDLPVREDCSMKVDDKLFINRLETYLNNGIKRINRLQEGIVQTQDTLNGDLMENDKIKISRAENSFAEFFKASEIALKYYDYYLDIISDLMIENKLLLKKYKKWKFNKKEMENIYTERQEEIKKEKESSEKDYFNPLIQEQKDKLKKHKLYNKKIK